MGCWHWYSADATQSWQTAVFPARAWPWNFSRGMVVCFCQMTMGSSQLLRPCHAYCCFSIKGTSRNAHTGLVGWLAEQVQAQWPPWESYVCGMRFSSNLRSYRALSPSSLAQHTRCLRTTLGFFQNEFRLLLVTSIFTLQIPHTGAHEHQRNMICGSGWFQGGAFITLSYVLLHPSSCLTALFICSGSDEVIDYPASAASCSFKFNPATQ